MTKETEAKLQSIKQSLDRLLRSYQALKSENEILKSQLEAQRRTSGDKNKKIEELEKQLTLIQTAQSIAHMNDAGEENGDRSEMKKKINDLIKEVDNCIAMLND